MNLKAGRNRALLTGLAMTGIAWLGLLMWESEDFWAWYSQYSPNRYRLLQQLLLQLGGYPLSLGQLMIITWGLSVVALLLVMTPDLNELVPLFILMAMMSAWFIVHSAPAYVLLALLCKYRNHKYSFLLLPVMTVLKEFVGYVGVITLLLYGNRFRAALGTALSIVAYFTVCALMGPADAAPGGPSLITLFYVIDVLQTPWAFPAAIFTVVITGAFSLLIRHPDDALLTALLVAPAFLFGLFWEPQLWLPAMIVLIYRRRWARDEDRESTELHSITAPPAGIQ